MMAQLRIDFQGRAKVETLSRARIQPISDGIQLTLIEMATQGVSSHLAAQDVQGPSHAPRYGSE